MLTPIQFAAQSYQARSGVVSEQRLVNLYLEGNPEGSKGPTTLYGTPGLRLWATVGDGPIRGVRRMGSYLYVVSGGELYAVESDTTATNVGSISGTGNVHMSDNGTHVAIATTSDLYAANLAGVLTLPESGMVGATYLDGYLVYAQGGGSGRFYNSGLRDATTIGALDYATAEASPDGLRGCIADHRELWLMGGETAEVWYNAGNATGSPFSRAQGGFIERGCSSGGSIAKARNTVFWLGDDGAVYAATGYQPQAISNTAIEALIDGADASTAWGWIYHHHGHTFYSLSFSDLSLCYDLETGMWHERQSDGLSRWRANCYAEAFGKHIVGDYADGRLYELDLDYYSDDGAAITREAVAPPLSYNGERVAMHELYIDCETGVGLNAGQGSAPVAMLDYSDDGGETWSGKLNATIGAIGARKVRLYWNRLGTFRQRSLRITITDPVKVAIVGAYARLEVRA